VTSDGLSYDRGRAFATRTAKKTWMRAVNAAKTDGWMVAARMIRY